MNMSAGGVRDAGAGIGSATYVDTFFCELAPVWLSYVAALRGLDTCKLDRPFTYMELGCGLGQSVIVNAGAYPASEFHACDFNASHIEAARTYAASIGVRNVHFHESSFEDLSLRELPSFDFIVLHGVYSWVDVHVRSAIGRFIQRLLKPSGLVYVSYNCMPGWAVEAPLRRMLVEFAAEESGTLAQKAERALGKLSRLRDARLSYFTQSPAIEGAVNAYGKQSPQYLAHEFLTESWQPFYCVDVSDDMRRAGLRYVGSATLVDNHDALTMESRIMGAVAGLATERERRLAEDFAMNRYFRRDVFAGEASTVDARRLGRVVVGRLDAQAPLQPQIRVPRGVVSFQRAFVEEVQQLMSRGSMAIDDLVAALSTGPERGTAEIVRNLTFLIAAGVLTPFAQERRFGAGPHRRQPANATVQKILDYSLQHRVARVLPSAALGNGFEIEHIEALALREIAVGVEQPQALSARLIDPLRQLADGEHAGQDSRDPAVKAESIAKRALYGVWPTLLRLGVFA